MNRDSKLWAKREQQALDMTIEQMLSRGFITHDLKPCLEIANAFQNCLERNRKDAHGGYTKSRVQNALGDAFDRMEDNLQRTT